MMNRRTLIRSLALAPVVVLASRLAFGAEPAKPAAAPKPQGTPPDAAGNSAKTAAAPANALGDQEPLAKAMQYVADASKAGASRTDKKANCLNCAKFNQCAPADSTCKTVAKGSEYAPCSIFAGKAVAAKGWCLSWAKGVS